MDEIILVKESLSASKLTNGRALLEQLDSSGKAIEAAYWVYSYETNDWRLFLVTPEVDRVGNRKTYESIQPITRKFPVAFRLNVGVRGLEDRFYQSMLELRRDRAFCDVEFDRYPVGDDLVDLYIYRLPAPIKKGKKNGRSTRIG